MKTIDSFNIKFKCYDVPKEQQIQVIPVRYGWRIGKIKGLLRNAYRVNPSYAIELSFKGEILPNDKLIDSLEFNPEKDLIKVMILSPTKM